MNEAVKEYKFQRGNLMLLPYDPRVGVITEDVLIGLYKRLKEEGLWEIVFHEDTGVTLLKFMNFFSSGSALLQILAISDGSTIVDFAGMSWIADINVCSGVLTRGVGSFVFFKEYQKPHFTDQFGEMILEYWICHLKINTILGVTPEGNRAAISYVKRLGLKEVGRLPEYTTFMGSAVDGVVTAMTQGEFLGRNKA